MMTPERWQQIDGLFQEALALTPTQRVRLLDRRCEGDPDLRVEVESLLAMDADSEGFAASAARNVEAAATGMLIQQRAGEFKLIRMIGSGGMGAVFLAERDDGEFQQRVAIKFANAVDDSEWLMERFLAERNILARLEHPNIARLIGGGRTDTGVRYLVMEYVDGQHLSDWLKQQPDRSLPPRIDLFLGICDAVAYAHRNLVIHRDIKPGNVMVTSDGRPKLLDFGISKVMDSTSNAEAAAATTVRVMTPPYASPEQVKGDFVSTATDVYSLGALLYEMLTGVAPFELGSTSSPARIERIICESDPVPPSHRAGAKGRALSGDLDTIVLKAMHKSPERRYSSVEAMAADLRLYLAGRPVAARPDTLLYRAGKFLRRRRIPVAVATMALLAAGFYGYEAVQEARRVRETFRQLRLMANAYLLEMPGRMEGRSAPEIQVEMARMYDRYAGPLIAAQPRDLNVPREIARGYEKLGNVLGIEDGVAIGQVREAMTYYGKVVHLLQPFLDRGDLDRGGKAILGRTHCAIGRLREFTAGKPGSGGADYATCLQILRQAVNGTTYRREYLKAHALAGDAALAFGNRAAAGWHYEEILRQARPHLGSAGNACFWTANGLLHRGRLNNLEGRPDSALADWKEALRLIRTGRKPAAADLFNVRLLELSLLRETAAVDPAFSAEAASFTQTTAAAYPSHPLVRAGH